MPAGEPGLEWMRAIVGLSNDALAALHKTHAANLQRPILELGQAVVRQVGMPVIGKRSTGKSTLINALLGSDVTPMEDDVATNVYLRLQSGEEGAPPRAVVVFHDPDRTPEDIPFSGLDEYATAHGSRRHEVAYVEIEHDSPVLADGLALFDTPGLLGLDASHTTAALAALADASAVMLVLDGRTPADEEDIAILKLAAEHVRHIIVAANKCDESDDAAGHVAVLEAVPGLDADVRALPVSAWLERHAQQLEVDGSDGTAALHELSGVARLRTVLAEVCDLVVREKHALLLDRVGISLNELTRPDREQVETAASGEDPTSRINELSMEIERIKSIPAVAKLNQRMATIEKEVSLEYVAGVARALAELRHEIETSWTPAISERLPEAAESRVRAAWLLAVNALRDRSAAAAGDLYRELGLEGEIVLVSRGEDKADALPATFARGDRLPVPTDAASPVERTVKRAMRVMLVAGAANLALPGIGTAILPIALPLGFYLARREELDVDKRRSRRAALEYLRANEHAASRLNSALASRATNLNEELRQQMNDSYLARLASLGQTMRGLQSGKVGLEAARSRLAAVEPLLERHRALLADPQCPVQALSAPGTAYSAIR
ncbi:dynamin family protein [Solirubrobacter ginsenosidimutans]|uniref:Dynamin family protein n=1 Tax=Solirubrobacter ginsenosidimutans TaxID=490573 RepID=A0A9X3MPB6_9ACTN|nr:dynamin family protein [Solirubrobacter ginsenosidimutans]MDA0159805.1 dynamin family protein [Solirubrobacter ginsenosidimutans]